VPSLHGAVTGRREGARRRALPLCPQAAQPVLGRVTSRAPAVVLQVRLSPPRANTAADWRHTEIVVSGVGICTEFWIFCLGFHGPLCFSPGECDVSIKLQPCIRLKNWFLSVTQRCTVRSSRLPRFWRFQAQDCGYGSVCAARGSNSCCCNRCCSGAFCSEAAAGTTVGN